MSDGVEAFLSGAVAPGVYRTGLRTTPAAIARAAGSRGWRAFHLDGRDLLRGLGFILLLAFFLTTGKNKTTDDCENHCKIYH